MEVSLLTAVRNLEYQLMLFSLYDLFAEDRILWQWLAEETFKQPQGALHEQLI